MRVDPAGMDSFEVLAGVMLANPADRDEPYRSIRSAVGAVQDGVCRDAPAKLPTMMAKPSCERVVRSAGEAGAVKLIVVRFRLP